MNAHLMNKRDKDIEAFTNLVLGVFTVLIPIVLNFHYLTILGEMWTTHV